MRLGFAVPLWLKYLLGFGLASLVLPVLDATNYSDLAFSLCTWVGFVLLALFPGKSARFPRMFWVMVALWSIAVPVLLVLLINDHLWDALASDLLPPGRDDIFRAMLLPYLVLYPALTLTLWKGLGAFRPLVILTALYDLLGFVVYYACSRAEPSSEALWTLTLDILIEMAVAAYLLLHFCVTPDMKTDATEPLQSTP